MGKGLQEGFTLVELLVVLMVASIALGIGIPATNDFVANGRMAGAANDLLSTMYFARSEAMSLGVPVTVCASTDASTDNPTCSDVARLVDGWIAFRDTNGDGRRDPDPAKSERVLAGHGAIPDSILRNAKTRSGVVQPQYLFFARDSSSPDLALGAPARDIQLCDERGARDMGNGLAAGRWIHVYANGRAVLKNQVTEVQGNPLGGC
jgi:prepilin-type N-terminal cleavage/methylation domain-containing protein